MWVWPVGVGQGHVSVAIISLLCYCTHPIPTLIIPGAILSVLVLSCIIVQLHILCVHTVHVLVEINSTYGSDATVGSTVALNQFQCTVCISSYMSDCLPDTLAEQ